MAISAVDISQNNITNDSNLMSVHNPLIFLINVSYSGTAPENFYCEVYDDTATLLGTFKCIPYVEVISTIRQFMFVADPILRGYMNPLDDELQSAGSLEYIENSTKVFTLKFIDLDDTELYDEVEIVAIHGTRQFGDDPNAEAIFENEAQVYYAFEGKPVYMYVYNSDTDNEIAMNPGGSISDVALDHDDTEFADTDDELFTIFIGI